MWACNVQDVTELGKGLILSMSNPLLDRLFIHNGGRLHRAKRCIIKCDAQPQDYKVADSSDYVRQLLEDNYFLAADLGSITIEQSINDPFVIAAACSGRKIYLYSDCMNNNSTINTLWICRS